MGEIKAGVILSLKDTFSAGMKSAGSAASGFASKTTAAMKKVNGLLSGTAAKLGAFGVSLSIGAAAKEIIDLDANMMRLGVQADISDEKIAELKQSIFDVASSPDIKVNTDELMNSLDQVIERTGDIDFATGSLEAMGLAIQATGASGEAIGGLFAEFQKMRLGADEAMTALDTLTVQGKAGAFTLENLAALGPRTISAYTATGRSGVSALREMGAALQVIRMGTGSSEQAATAFEAVMRNLTSPDKQAALRKLGVTVKDSSGNFRSVTDIMEDIVTRSKGSTEILGQIFDSEAMRAFNFAIGEFQRQGAVTSFGKFNEMLSDGSVIQRDSARNAATLKSNIANLQTAFIRFADSNLTEPLAILADNLNKLAEDPDKFQRVFKGIAIGLGAIVAVKGLASLVSLISNLKGLKGGALQLPSGNQGSMGLPVHVTNWSGGSGSLPALPSGTTAGSTGMSVLNPRGANAQNFAAGARSAGAIALVATGVAQTVNAVQAVQAIDADETLSGKEKSTQKGGAIGEAVGTTVGTGLGVAAGALAAGKIGAIIGTAIAPGIGTAIGGLIGAAGGALVGWIGGKAGRAVGEKIGDAIGKDDVPRKAGTAPDVPGAGMVSGGQVPREIAQEFNSVVPPPAFPELPRLDGKAVMDVNLNITDGRPEVSATFRNNTTPIAYQTGSTRYSRSLAQ